MSVDFEWRGGFASDEVEHLHAEAFERDVGDWDWVAQVERHSLGWVTARRDGRLVGFVNVPWDGLAHAWIIDTIVSADARHEGIGSRLIEVAVEETRRAGCEWLHVDFDEPLTAFYLEACGFNFTPAGLIEL